MKFLIYLIPAFLLFGCKHKNEYHVHGNVSGLKDGTILYLRLVDSGQDADSVVVKNGTFEFKGEAEGTPQWATLSLKGKFLPVCDLYLEKGDINIEGQIYQCKLSGTKTNCEYNTYKQTLTPLYSKHYAQLTELALNGDKRGQAFKDSINAEIKKTKNQLEDEETNYICKYSNSIISLKVLDYKSRHMTGDQLKKTIAMLDVSLQDNPQVVRLKNYANQLSSVKKDSFAPDFSLVTSTGDQFKLSEQKGKYILLDFWASWCVPCRNSLPEIAHLYNKYKNEKFEVIGVSIDKNTAKWETALTEENCSWLQICDNKGIVAKLYAVQSVPLTVIISPEGKIISRGLHKKELSDKLTDIFKY